MRRSSAVVGQTRSLFVTSRQQRLRGNPRLAIVLSRLGRTKLPRDTHVDPESPASPSTRVHARSSLLRAAVDEQEPPTLCADSPPESDGPPSEPDKPPRRSRTTTSGTGTSTQRDRDPDSDDRSQLPSGLDILWLPDAPSAPDSSRANVLPPPELFEEALTNLHITLHPQTQHRAAHVTPTGPPVEPTLALYCPVEGGEYVIDETVRELARRTGAEVLVIDAVQLAAGEWGHFGKAANAIQLPRNPLHYHPSPSQSPASRRQSRNVEEEDEADTPPYSPSLGIAQMTLHVLAPAMASRGRQPPLFTTSRSSAPPNRIKAFFDDLVNFPSPGQHTRPRLIYIRDFPTLAPTAPTWYPHLLSAVRARRTGPIARPSSSVACPMTIICGITPPLVGQNSGNIPASSMGAYPVSGSHLPGGGRRRHTSRPAPSAAHGVSPSASSQTPSEWGEDDHATHAREKRLRQRLRRWEHGGDSALLEDVSRLLAANPMGASGTVSTQSSPFSQSSPSPFAMSPYPSSEGDPSRPIGEGGDNSAASAGGAPTFGRFFRASVVLPSVRDVGVERQCRMARRREVNELAMRMGVGGIGGVLEEDTGATRYSEGAAVEDHVEENDDLGEREEKVDSIQSDAKPDTRSSSCAPESHLEGVPTGTSSQPPEEHEMWADWSTCVEPWAVGSVVAAQPPASSPLYAPGLEPTACIMRSSRSLRKTWTKDARKEDGEELDGEEAEEGRERVVDEVVEAIKQDKDLDPHEERLLGCIVDPNVMVKLIELSQVSISTTHTVDSVRTLHAMAGCLLFGPPGTGKTLIVRALAKEAGSRMLMVSPSDVMDMYVGEGEKLVRAVFSLARRLSPCVVFLDEIDALFGARTSSHNSGGVIAHRGVITEFMQEMDGLKSRAGEERVIVIGATNRPFDLDDAVLRRLPRRLLGILKILLRDETLSPDLDLKSLAKRTESFSGSDLKHLCVSAALAAVKEDVNLPWDTPLDAISAATNDNQPPNLSSTDLRKWNEQFGEGRKDKRRLQVWGRGRFGFTDATFGLGQDEGRISEPREVAKDQI
ncbi:AAA-domain-containing protein [Pisolithus albus]|nr:AAA-domain-containing protein [Pisolithus albus]